MATCTGAACSSGNCYRHVSSSSWCCCWWDVASISPGCSLAPLLSHCGAASRRKDAPPTDRPNPLATQFEVSAKGIVINSSVLGVVILGLSLAFFYLYLVYVYPIQDVF